MNIERLNTLSKAEIQDLAKVLAEYERGKEIKCLLCDKYGEAMRCCKIKKGKQVWCPAFKVKTEGVDVDKYWGKTVFGKEDLSYSLCGVAQMYAGLKEWGNMTRLKILLLRGIEKINSEM